MLGVDVNGEAETRRALERNARDIYGSDVLGAFRTATLLIQRQAKLEAPADTGKLRNSIVTEVSVPAGSKNIRGVIGTVIVYAPYMELGTRPHTPPAAALETWARRHGMSVGAVIKSIEAKGTTARNFFKNSFEDNKAQAVSLIEAAISRTISK